MQNAQIFQLADRLQALKEKKKSLDDESKATGAEIEQVNAELSEAMAENECDRFSRNGSTFYLSSRLFASPAAGAKDDMIEALRENGYGGLVSETVNANTLASFCREQMEANGDELPEWLKDVVNTYEKVTVGIRKG